MIRKKRIRLVVVLVVLGVPLVLAGVFAFYTVTGRLGGWLGIWYAKHMPGHLTVGQVAFTATDQVQLTDLAIAEGFAAPLARITGIDAKVDVFNGRLSTLAMHGVMVRLDEGTFDLLQRIIDANDKIKPSGQPQSWDLVADGEVTFASGLRLTRASAKGRITGPLFEIEGTCCIGDAPDAKPLHVIVASRPQGVPTPGAPVNRRITVELLEAEVPVPEALDALASIGLLPETPAGLKRWLPKRVDVSGSVVHRDLGVLHFAAPVQARWTDAQGRPGTLLADLDADANRITLAIAEFKDPAVGRIGDAGGTRTAANLAFDQRTATLAFDSPRFVPGPGLGIPDSVPVEALLRFAPRLKVGYRIDGGATEIQLSGPDQSGAQVRMTWSANSPLRVEASALPLTLAQGFMPPGVVIGGGQAAKLALTLAGDGDAPAGGAAQAAAAGVAVRDLRLQLTQGRATWNGWSVGPLDGTLAMMPLAGAADGGRQFDATLPMGTLGLRGNGRAGTASVRIQAVDALLARLHGPIEQLPTVSGALEVDLAYTRDAAGLLVVDLPRATLDRADVRYQGQDLLQGVHTSLKGRIQSTPAAPDIPATVTVKVGGQLAGGQLRLPTGWLDLAIHNPIFTIDAAIRPGTTKFVELRELLVRAADAAGTPVPNGYSAGFAGSTDENGNGTVTGVVDHADLAWTGRQARLPPGAVDGEGALQCDATLAQFAVARVTGHFLPLNAEVALGIFRASGIVGAVDFTLERATAEPPAKDGR